MTPLQSLLAGLELRTAPQPAAPKQDKGQGQSLNAQSAVQPFSQDPVQPFAKEAFLPYKSSLSRGQSNDPFAPLGVNAPPAQDILAALAMGATQPVASQSPQRAQGQVGGVDLNSLLKIISLLTGR